MNILESATKIVLILIALTVCIAYTASIFLGKTAMETKDFLIIASGVFGFYFAYKGESNQPYAGK